MTESMLGAEKADRRRAFLGLLACQTVAPWSDPALYALVHRHVSTITTWCARLGYRLAHIDQCYRLRRVPLEGDVAVPRRKAPPRSLLLLSLYAAACLDDHREDSITLQDLSDLVHLSTAGLGAWPYDPNVRTHRQSLISAIALLSSHGVLEQRTDEVLVDGWERSGDGIGAGYLLHRDALTLLVDTGDIDLALAGPPTTEDDTRGMRLLRTLVETQAILTGELPESEQAYLVGQRTRLAGLAEEMTGGVVEIHADAIALVLPADRDLPSSLQLDFPGATARDWVALSLLDSASRESDGSYRRCTRARLEELAGELHSTQSHNLTKEFQDSAATVLAAAEERLAGLGFLRVQPDGAWELTPLAGRYRDADLHQTPVAPTALFQEEP